MDNAIIWWLSQQDCEELGEDPKWDMTVPNYIKTEYNSRYGQPGHGRLWVSNDVELGITEIEPEALLSGNHDGIVICESDEEHVACLPGTLTDLKGNLLFEESPRMRRAVKNGHSVFKPIKWSGVREGRDYGPGELNKIPYTHVIGACGMGFFVITWKSWKDEKHPNIPGKFLFRDGRMIDKAPWEDSFGQYGGDTEEEAMETAERLYGEKIMATLSSSFVSDEEQIPVDSPRWQWDIDRGINALYIYQDNKPEKRYYAGANIAAVKDFVKRLNKAPQCTIEEHGNKLSACWRWAIGDSTIIFYSFDDVLNAEQKQIDESEAAEDSTDETHKEDAMSYSINNLRVKNSNQQPFRIPFFHRLMHMTREELLDQTYEFRVPNPESSTGFDIYQGTASQVFRGFKGIENGRFITTFLLKSPALPQTVFVEEDDITGVQVRSVGSDEDNIYTNVLIDSSCYFTGKYGQLPGKNPVQSFKKSKSVLEFDDEHGLTELSIEQIDWMSETSQEPADEEQS